MKLNVVAISISLFINLIACNSINDQEQAFYSDGSLRLKVPMKDGLRDGQLVQYYKNGSIELKSTWKQGKKHGKLVSFYENGNIKTIEYFKDDVRVDSLVTYDSLGNTIEKMFYSNGARNGPYFLYYPSGELKISGNIKDDKKHGKAETYYPDGKLQRREIYENGQLVYSVDYTKNGVPYNFHLSIDVHLSDNSDTIKIDLEHSFYDNSYIGVIFGSIDSKGVLLDTLDRVSADGTEIQYELTQSLVRNDTVSGMLYEINSKDLIEAEYPFKIAVPN